MNVGYTYKREKQHKQNEKEERLTEKEEEIERKDTINKEQKDERGRKMLRNLVLEYKRRE